MLSLAKKNRLMHGSPTLIGTYEWLVGPHLQPTELLQDSQLRMLTPPSPVQRINHTQLAALECRVSWVQVTPRTTLFSMEKVLSWAVLKFRFALALLITLACDSCLTEL